jgi:hypothetical protein
MLFSQHKSTLRAENAMDAKKYMQFKAEAGFGNEAVKVLLVRSCLSLAVFSSLKLFLNVGGNSINLN